MNHQLNMNNDQKAESNNTISLPVNGTEEAQKLYEPSNNMPKFEDYEAITPHYVLGYN
ncbi:hypothetical protein Q4489_16845 [Thalassotalea sp. 1_MG-2023]|uniref:hypothetical protein n=1 Tax=Thalassotalea sp. 1_MG-2023 TaxID=3062680 RepID=UPI0026E403D3|nr:hypothetical protein [Thalassotalea sp. 1_MG-2023]MDO6428681.1 hypothetical protein [Thalassotalea sp. 1_MG-2023]